MASASAIAAGAATAATSGSKRKRLRVSVTAGLAFVLSAIILWYAQLLPLPDTASPSLSPPLVLLSEEEKLAPMGSSHNDKDGGLTRLATLPPAHLPTPVADSPRLIVIGDVHGQLDALEALLAKAEFSRARGDHVIFVGDMVSKGPDSGGVVDLAMSIKASAVRGNHEDRVLRAWEWEQERGQGLFSSSEEEEDDEQGEEEEEEEVDAERKKKGKGKGKGKKKHKPSREDRATASRLTAPQRAWLDSLPVILRVGPIAPYGDVLVVHGGLVPGLALADQDLRAVMNMRSLLRRRKLKKSWRSRTYLEKDEEDEAVDDDVDVYEEEDDDYHHELEPYAQQQQQKQLAPAPEHALVPSGGHRGRPWSAVWNALQRQRAKDRGSKGEGAGDRDREPTTTAVIYGHDARVGLSVREYTLGLDSGCVAGGELTAAVFEAVEVSGSEAEEGEGEGKKEKEKDKAVVIKRRLVSVKCEAYDWKGGKKKKNKKNKDKKKHKNGKIKEGQEEVKEEEEQEEEEEI
ncbi:Metallo-dependent phosphatase-like protein [Biscogniauxia mediterranea]|nr:Metallo-dependent phosphatase-like protein [Biscogniauxia mediterranea]